MTLVAAIPGLAITGCVFSGILAALHIYIFILESVLWRKRAGKVFRLPQIVVENGTVLAANQGFYNLLLAVGLIWGLAELNGNVLLFFLAAICTAGIFGAITASPRILFVQVIPGFLGFTFTDFGFVTTSDWSNWRHPLYVFIIFLVACLVTSILTFMIKKFFLNQTPKGSTKPNSINNDDI